MSTVAHVRRLLAVVRLLLAAVTGYLFGTIPSADVATRLATSGQGDLRRSGTGNPGAANAMKVLGTGWGLGVMGADIGKGFAASRVGGRIAGDVGAHAAGVGAVVGHCYPAWNGFRGGKGVAASAGQCLATFPAYFAFDTALAAGTSSVPALRNRAETATRVASVAWVAAAAVWWRRGWPNAWGPTPSAALPLAAAASSAVILKRFADTRHLVEAAEGQAATAETERRAS